MLSRDLWVRALKREAEKSAIILPKDTNTSSAVKKNPHLIFLFLYEKETEKSDSRVLVEKMAHALKIPSTSFEILGRSFRDWKESDFIEWLKNNLEVSKVVFLASSKLDRKFENLTPQNHEWANWKLGRDKRSVEILHTYSALELAEDPEKKKRVWAALKNLKI